jgi:feruloyl-CoA synthase
MAPEAGKIDLHAVPYREVDFPPLRMEKTTRPDGTVMLRSREPLAEFDPSVVRGLFQQADAQPDKTLYAQRRVEPDGSRGNWICQSFAETRERVRAIGQWLIDRDYGTDDPLLILSGNSIAHATMRFGAMAAGVPSCPVSPNYALLGGDFERLRYVLDLVDPRVIFAESGSPFAAALKAIDLQDRVVISRRPDQVGVDAVSYDAICATGAKAEVDARVDTADPDAHALYMLTSGSTGMPKAVIQTQRMWATNLHQGYQVLGRAAGWHDVMLDWLPWSHVSGSFNMMAAALFGGTLYIDEGKPVPGLFDETIRNLREIAVPYFSNMPAGYAFLVDALESDEALCRTFFSKLRLLLYGGAGLPQPLYDRLQAQAVRTTGKRIAFTTGYGATETTSGCMVISFLTEKVGIGLPTPGLEVKLVPTNDRYEIRMRGDNIMPGYLRDPAKTAEVFDGEGFYRTADAARFHDDDDVNQGLYFAGRLAEEFKLGTGTWVYAGQVRTNLIEALAPAITDLLLCGIGRDCLAALGVPSLAGLRAIAESPGAPLEELESHENVTQFLRQSLQRYNAQYPGSSTRIERFAFIREMPSAEKRELSDKGTVNQFIAAENRKAEIDALYAEPAAAGVIVAGDP